MEQSQIRVFFPNCLKYEAFIFILSSIPNLELLFIYFLFSFETQILESNYSRALNLIYFFYKFNLIFPLSCQYNKYSFICLDVLQQIDRVRMAEIEEYHEEIQTTISKLSNMIHRSPLFSTNKKKWKDECNKFIQNITDFIRTCEELISQMPASSVRHYVSKTKSFKKELDQLKDDYQKKLKEERQGKMDQSQKDEYDRYHNIQTVIKRGDQTQDRTNQAIDSMFQTVDQGISLADEINISLTKQIQQLDRIHGKVKDTETSLKRAQKSINYFMKALECDKCMLGLILLNVLALIALIVLLVKKK